MWEKIRVVFTIPELRQKIFLTLLFLAIYRIGWQIPLPVVDLQKMTAFAKTAVTPPRTGKMLDKTKAYDLARHRVRVMRATPSK